MNVDMTEESKTGREGGERGGKRGGAEINQEVTSLLNSVHYHLNLICAEGLKVVM